MTESTYHGFKRIDYQFQGHDAVVIFPDQAEEQRRWIWRAEFLGAFDTVDVAMLKAGWHLVYYRISDMYGCPAAVELMDQFYQHVVAEYNLHPKTVLLGFSRGGLYSLAFAGRFPERMGALYLDAPALSIFQWPCRPGDQWARERSECMRWYHLKEGDTDTPDDPIHQLPTIVRHRIPLVMVIGLADEAVPYEKNGKVMVDAYQQAGAPLSLHLKPNCGHHPHSLEDPTPIVEYLLEQVG